MGIWQDLVDKHGFTSSYQSVQRFVLKLRGAVSTEARVIIETRPGEEAQVDYGTGPMVRDPDSGKYRRTRLFVMALGCSRKCVRLLAFRSSARVWAELHEKAFRRLTISGPGKIIGVGNGDPNCQESDKEPKRSLFNGLAQVIVQSTKTFGEIQVEAGTGGGQGSRWPQAKLVIASKQVASRPSVPVIRAHN